jgi:DNA end-binding protein Ku
MAGMRAILSVDISLGLFSVPVKLYTAVEEGAAGFGFRQLHRECKTPINMTRHCGHCERDIAYEEIVKGTEAIVKNAEGGLAPGWVTVEESELAALKPQRESLKVLGYVGAVDIDPTYFTGSVYYLLPGSKDATAFATFRDSLGERAALGRVVLWGREHVVCVRPAGRAMTLHTMRSMAEFRRAKELPGYDALPSDSPEEYRKLMGQIMARDAIKLEDVVIVKDAYRMAVEKLVQSKAAGTEFTPEVAPEAPKTPDLLAALQALAGGAA